MPLFGAQSGATRALTRLALMLVPLFVVVAVYAPTLRFGHFGDTRFLIEHNRFMSHWSEFWPNATHDYFWCSDGVSIPYWRPLTKLSWLAERLLGGARPVVHHVVHLAWFVVALTGVRAIAVRLGASAEAAAVATLLAGLHPAAIEPTCLVMARSDLVAAAGVAWSFAAWISWHSTGKRAWGVAHAIALALALASKEVAVVAAPLVTLWAFILERDRDRLRLLAPKLVPAWTLVALYLVARHAVLADLARSRAGFDGLTIFVGGARYLEALLPLRFDSGITSLSRSWAASPTMLARSTATWAALATLGALALRRRQPGWIMLLAWIAASLAPTLLVRDILVPGVAGKIPLADRWALQSVMAASVLWMLVLEQLPRRLRRGMFALIGVWAIGACVVAGAQHSYYRSETAYVEFEDEAYQSIPERYRTNEDRCRFADHRIVEALRQARTEDAYVLSARSRVLCADDSALQFNFLSSAVRTGRYAEARQMMSGLLRDPRYVPLERASLMLLSGIVMLRTGAPAVAWQLFQDARTLGLSGCEIDLLSAEAAAFQEDVAIAARERARAARCVVHDRRP